MKQGVIKNYRWIWLLICLMAPVFAGFIRKFVPQQPNWIEPLVTTVVAFVMLFLVVNKNIKTENYSAAWFMELLSIWFAIQFIYLIPTMFYSFQMSGMAFCVRLLPMIGAFTAFRLVQNRDDLRRIANFFGWFSVVMLPLGIIVMLKGNKLMPFFLQPIKRMIELGKNTKGGFDTCALVFNTEVTLAFSFLAITFLLLANMQQETRREQIKNWVFIASSLVLIYISTQRGALWVAIGGLLVHFIIQKGAQKKRTVISFIFVAIIFLVIDRYSYVDVRYFHYEKRSSMMTSVDIGNRYGGVFLGHVKMWINRKPFGAFLGFAGPENQIFGTSQTPKAYGSVEVGGALLAAEMGYIGLLGMPIIVFVLIFLLITKSKPYSCYKTVVLLSSFIGGYFIIFFMKYAGAMIAVNIAQISFWIFAGIAAKLIAIERRNSVVQNGSIKFAIH